jgi:RNA polymerase sigma-70 factor (ECF subfamily)
MLKDFPGVARWEKPDDVLQDALIRLELSLKQAAPATGRDFFRLAAARIRRELNDLARHCFGPAGLGANYKTWGEGDTEDEPRQPGDATSDPALLAAWSELDARIRERFAADRDLFDLLWYQGITQADAAAVLEVSERTINKRWIAARLRLRDTLGVQLPV